MKRITKIKTILLITVGIFFTLSPIITNNLSFTVGNSDKRTEYSEDVSADNGNLKISKLSGKIHIDNNWTATKSAGICTGEGTYSNLSNVTVILILC